LEEIIERDFFPDLERLKLQQQYQEALKSNDYGALQQLYYKYNRLNSSTSKRTSSTIETPKLFDPIKKITKKKEEEDSEEYANKEPPQSAEKEHSLDTFLAKNTSEDNFSFEVIMEEHEKKQQAKSHQAWLHEKEQLHLMVNIIYLYIINVRKNIEFYF
jgi:protein DGCR14